MRSNSEQFIATGLIARGFDTMMTETAIVPVLCGSDDVAFQMTQLAQERNKFVLPVITPVVPQGLARLRATVTAAHVFDEINQAMNVVEQAGIEVSLLS